MRKKLRAVGAEARCVVQPRKACGGRRAEMRSAKRFRESKGVGLYAADSRRHREEQHDPSSIFQ